MIEILILFTLQKYDATIYRIQKIIDELFFAYIKTTAGTLHPALKRLETIGCVEYQEKMTEGGMLSKTYSITQTGKKHLEELLLNYEIKNPYKVINDIKLLLCCSKYISLSNMNDFKNNLKNNLELYKIKLQKGLNNDYIELNEIQKKTVEITLNEINELEKII